MSRRSRRPDRTDRSVGPSAATVSPERVIERATTATGDVEAAASFVEDGGLVTLRTAIARADPATARRGRRALAAFRWIRWAARAEPDE